jgi:hypothetical protein
MIRVDRFLQSLFSFQEVAGFVEARELLGRGLWEWAFRALPLPVRREQRDAARQIAVHQCARAGHVDQKKASPPGSATPPLTEARTAEGLFSSLEHPAPKSNINIRHNRALPNLNLQPSSNGGRAGKAPLSRALCSKT